MGRTSTGTQSADAWASNWPDSIHCGYMMLGRAALYAVLASLPVFGFGAWVCASIRNEQLDRGRAVAAMYAAHDRIISAAPADTLPLQGAAHGRDLFLSSCAACHKADGTGLEGLGKDLTQSWFVAALDDARLVSFITSGRPIDNPLNTTKSLMPPKGGHEELTDANLADIVMYVRGLQDPRRMPALPAPVAVATAPVTADEKAAALAAAGGDAELAEYIAHGSKLFANSCTSCHGKDARGLPGQGKNLVASEFCKSLDDDKLLEFIKRGRDPNDPLNTTKVAMPPKGGNPVLGDDDLLDIISYVRSLQRQASAAK